MQVSFEISLYPLAIDEYKSEIWSFIHRIKANEELNVVTNGMSTQVFGEYDLVSSTVMTEIKRVHEEIGSAVFIVKIVNGNRAIPEEE